jgi:predicted RNase H-like HicB family nuclease
MLNGTSHRLGLTTYNYIYTEIACGDYMVHVKQFPYVTAVGKTKAEAKSKLDVDLKEISTIKKKEHKIHV